MGQLSGSNAQAALLEGLERSAGEVDAPVLYILAGIVSSESPADQAITLYGWYLERLYSRIAEGRQGEDRARNISLMRSRQRSRGSCTDI